MSELALLFVVVVGLYVFQCIFWVPLQAVVFRIRVFGKGRRAHRRFAWNALNIAGSGSSLLPAGSLLVVNWPAAAVSPDGLSLKTTEGPTPWNRVALKRAGSRLLCEGTVVLQGPAAQLKEFEEMTARLASAKSKAHPQIIERWLRKSLDLEAAKARVGRFRRESRLLAVLACMELLLLFGVTPYLFDRLGTRAILPAVTAVLTTSLAITIEFWVLHKRFYRKESDSRWTSALTILFSPISAIRAMDGVARDLLAGYHPVVAAAALCSPEEFAAFAGEQLRQLSFSADAHGWYAGKLKDGLEKVVAQAGLSAEKLMAPPEREDDCRFYCPRCLAQYVATRAACADCGYEALAEF